MSTSTKNFSYRDVNVHAHVRTHACTRLDYTHALQTCARMRTSTNISLPVSAGSSLDSLAFFSSLPLTAGASLPHAPVHTAATASLRCCFQRSVERGITGAGEERRNGVEEERRTVNLAEPTSQPKPPHLSRVRPKTYTNTHARTHEHGSAREHTTRHDGAARLAATCRTHVRHALLHTRDETRQLSTGASCAVQGLRPPS